jgi:hypothetical protein
MTPIPGLLFSDDLVFSAFTINGLQKAVNQVIKWFRERNLKCNLSKTILLVFKKGGKQKEEDRWTANDQKN